MSDGNGGGTGIHAINITQYFLCLCLSVCLFVCLLSLFNPSLTTDRHCASANTLKPLVSLHNRAFKAILLKTTTLFSPPPPPKKKKKKRKEKRKRKKKKEKKEKRKKTKNKKKNKKKSLTTTTTHRYTHGINEGRRQT